MSVVKHAFSGAWLLPEDASFDSWGIYYSFPFKYKETSILEDDPSYITDLTIYNRQSKSGYSNFYEYGLNDTFNISGKLDFEQVKDLLKVKTNLDELELDIMYHKLVTEFKFKNLLDQNDNHIHSLSLDIFPGHFLFLDNSVYYFKKPAAIGLSLNYGYSSKYIFEYYIDTTLQYRNYFDNSHSQINFNILLGIKPMNRMLMQLGLYNTIEGQVFNEHPFNHGLLKSTIDDFDLSPQNKITLYDEIYRSLKSSNTYQYHQLSIKLGYEVDCNKTINIEAFTDIFNNKPFKANTLALTYDIKL